MEVFFTETKPYLHKVQYYETDQMAVVHHSNYVRWFEEARMDWFGRIGLPVRKVEELGAHIPVVSCNAHYLMSARLEDVVEIRAFVKLYNGVRLIMGYEVRLAETGELLATGETEHCFTSSKDGKILNLKRKLPEVHALLTAELAAGH